MRIHLKLLSYLAVLLFCIVYVKFYFIVILMLQEMRSFKKYVLVFNNENEFLISTYILNKLFEKHSVIL